MKCMQGTVSNVDELYYSNTFTFRDGIYVYNVNLNEVMSINRIFRNMRRINFMEEP